MASRLVRIFIVALVAVGTLSAADTAVANPLPAGAAWSCAVGLSAGGSHTSHYGRPTIHCFSTFAAALRYATRGRVEVAADATTVTGAQLVAAHAASTPTQPASNPVLGFEYVDSNYGGTYDVLYGSNGTGCYNGVTYGFPSLGGLNDVISSAKGLSGCYGIHYQNVNYNRVNGASITCPPNCPGMGAMNDQTSSIKFY